MKAEQTAIVYGKWVRWGSYDMIKHCKVNKSVYIASRTCRFC